MEGRGDGRGEGGCRQGVGMGKEGGGCEPLRLGQTQTYFLLDSFVYGSLANVITRWGSNSQAEVEKV